MSNVEGIVKAERWDLAWAKTLREDASSSLVRCLGCGKNLEVAAARALARGADPGLERPLLIGVWVDRALVVRMAGLFEAQLRAVDCTGCTEQGSGWGGLDLRGCVVGSATLPLWSWLERTLDSPVTWGDASALKRLIKIATRLTFPGGATVDAPTAQTDTVTAEGVD